LSKGTCQSKAKNKYQGSDWFNEHAPFLLVQA
jgi:hypothetical protein